MFRHKNLIYQGNSIKIFNELRDLMDIYHVKYSYEVRDSVDDIGGNQFVSYFGRQQAMSVRAFTGSRGTAGENIKCYFIYADKEEMKKVPLEILKDVVEK